MTKSNRESRQRALVIHFLQRFNLAAFVIGFIFMFGGIFVLGPLGFERISTLICFSGLAAIAALAAQFIVVFPFLRCPACEKPFFKPPGWYYQVRPHQRACRNCRMHLDQMLTANCDCNHGQEHDTFE